MKESTKLCCENQGSQPSYQAVLFYEPELGRILKNTRAVFSPEVKNLIKNHWLRNPCLGIQKQKCVLSSFPVCRPTLNTNSIPYLTPFTMAFQHRIPRQAKLQLTQDMADLTYCCLSFCILQSTPIL